MTSKVMLAAVLLALGCGLSAAQPFAPGSGFVPLGNLRTSDRDGPYNLTLLPVQVADVRAGLAAKMNYTDRDIIDFLVNAECLEGLFTTWGVFGTGFNGDLEKGGPVPIGAQKANLSYNVQQMMEEVALDEQGHALFTRHAGSELPCPLIDFTGGFNQFLAAAYQLPAGQTVEQAFGAPFNPFADDQSYLISQLTLEEVGATGNKGLIGLTSNPVLADGIAGLATSATAQATIERMLLWNIRNATVNPFNETAQQVFARISALRDSLDGPQVDDQGLVNTDPRTIAVPSGFPNMISTDVQGLTFARTPLMNINILTLGSPNGKGCFFPNGLGGAINKPTGYNVTAQGLDSFPTAGNATAFVGQEAVAAVGNPPPPISTSYNPANVTDELVLTQAVTGPLDNGTAATRGLVYSPPASPYISSTPVAAVATSTGVDIAVRAAAAAQYLGLAPASAPAGAAGAPTAAAGAPTAAAGAPTASVSSSSVGRRLLH